MLCDNSAPCIEKIEEKESRQIEDNKENRTEETSVVTKLVEKLGENQTEPRKCSKETPVPVYTRSWDEMVITPLNGIPPLGCSPPPPRQNTSPLPYSESPDDDDELQFFLEME